MGSSETVSFWFIEISKKKNSLGGPNLIVESNIQLFYFRDCLV